MFTAGQLVNERYRVLSQISRGDFGPVFGAKDTVENRTCVLKPITLENDADTQSLQQETEKIQALKHPHIVPPGTLEMTEQQEPFLVRKFIEGSTLEELISHNAPLPLSRSCTIARQIAMALEAAHHAGLVHGDLKPSNILLAKNKDGESVKVLGFGTLLLKKDRFTTLARLAVRKDGQRLFGTPEYISPEQAAGTGVEALDGRSDLYSLGVILYQMLTGELPHQGKNVMEVLLAQIFAEPRPLSSRTDLEVPIAVDTLLMRTLAKKRTDRPASATALIDQLGPWEERKAAATPPLAPEKAPKPEPQGLEATLPGFTTAPQELKPQPPPAFVPDLKPPVEIEPIVIPKRGNAPAASLDVQLRESGPVMRPTPAPQPVNSGSVLFANFHPRTKPKPRHTGLKVLAIAMLLIVILIGAGCGWLYFTGRTYWFDSDFIKTRVSYYLSVGTSDASPQTEVVSQPTPQSPPAPVTKPDAAPATAKPQPARGGSATPAAIAPAPYQRAAASRPTRIRNAITTPKGSATSSSNHRNVVSESIEVQDAIARGQYYFSRGDYDAAIQVYEKSLELFPSNQKLIEEIARAKRAKAAEAKYLQ